MASWNDNYVFADDVFFSPEFRPFAARLGIDLSLPIKKLDISIEFGSAVEVQMKFLGIDNKETSDVPQG